MELFYFLLIFSFLALGVYGGGSAVTRWARGYQDIFAFTPTGGAVYALLLIIIGSSCFYAMSKLTGIAQLASFALLPFALLGHIMWMVAFVMQVAVAIASPTDMPVEKTYDVADGLMMRGKYAEAEQKLREELAADPLDIEAFMRMCRAIESDGREEQAARELAAAHKALLEHKDEKALPRDKRQARLLRITYALGDILVSKLDELEAARRLYTRTLETLYGYPDADPLRDRLKSLEQPGRMTGSEAVSSLQPSRIKLDEQ
jgi:hypothetical protein